MDEQISDELIKLVKTYRVTAGLPDRLRFMDEILAIVGPQIRLFIISRCSPNDALDIIQKVLIGISQGTEGFKGATAPEFWGWCYSIARNKLADQYGKDTKNRVHFMEPDMLEVLSDASLHVSPVSVEDRELHTRIMDILRRATPECYGYFVQHFIQDMDYQEIAAAQKLDYDAVRMRIARCLEKARALLT